jgi:hypothetical protein
VLSIFLCPTRSCTARKQRRRGDTVFAYALAPDKQPEILPAYMHEAAGDDTATPQGE